MRERNLIGSGGEVGHCAYPTRWPISSNLNTIRARATRQDVVTDATLQDVVAGAAHQGVVPAIALQNVVQRAADKAVVPGTASNADLFDSGDQAPFAQGVSPTDAQVQ